MSPLATSFAALLVLALSMLAAPARKCRAELTLIRDMVLDNDALLMPATATYGRAINGVSFQTESLLSVEGYQYATWYHLGSNEDVYVARRSLGGDAWQVVDTGGDFTNGDSPAWDAHNVISMGISGDDRVHFSWDHHGHTLRYKNSTVGAATGATWNASLFNPERSTLNSGGPSISTLTYPMFVTNKATGDMLFAYRTGGSGAGDLFLGTYDAATGLWDAPHQVINGTSSLFYDDAYGESSTNRNAYVNGIDIDSTGRIHTTWTWRESAGGTNHDIMYAYSDDGGDTWRNDAGAVVGAVGSPINLNSPGIIIVPKDRGNTLMNQQTQAVDADGRVHMVMWHKTDEAPPVSTFTTDPAAYFHYYRNPASGVWTRTELPTTCEVGSRPDMAYDEQGNLYVAYVSPGEGDAGGYYTNGDLVIASASKATGYEDWEIISTDTRDFAGEPFIDQQRLLSDGIISTIIQENDSGQPGATGTPLHVIEWNRLANLVVWAGDDAGAWSNAASDDWDSDNDNLGDAAFAPGYRTVFGDGAADFNVDVAAPVAPASTTFKNTLGNNYVLTGAAIVGNGGLTVTGGGSVTLANAPSTYTGDTIVTAGTLNLMGPAAIASSTRIEVAAGATLNASGSTAGGMNLSHQSLAIAGQVAGNVTVANSSAIEIHAANSILGNVVLQSGSLISGAGGMTGNLSAQSTSIVRVGGDGLPSTLQPTVQIIDNFNDGVFSEYVRTTLNDGSPTAPNVSFTGSSGGLRATAAYPGAPTFEQVVFLRNDIDLAIGETLAADVAMSDTGLQMDLGLAVSSTATPPAATAGDSDTRDAFDWTSVAVRPSQDNIRVNRSVAGVVNTTAGALTSVPETSVTSLYIIRNSATQFTVGYTDASSASHDAAVIDYTAGAVGSAIGFYADVRAAGSLGLLDNLRIIGDQNVYVGETLTIAGDVSLATGAALELDIFTPAVVDSLQIGGALNAGGALAVTLAAGSPAPALGDAFDILQFNSASGAFDSFDLPALAGGLAWDVSSLLTTGALEVVADVDLNNDGYVDGGDLLLAQRTSPSLIATWRSLFGSQLVNGSAGTATLPEPSSALLVLSVLAALRMSRGTKAERPAK